MSDLISRCELFNRLAPVQTLGEAYSIIQGMPTVEPELATNLLKTCNQLATDCISRQAAIDAIVDQTIGYTVDEIKAECEEYIFKENGYLGGLKDAIEAIEDMPSAEPEKRTEERTETHECDLISRQAAIMHFVKASKSYECGMFNLKELTHELWQLPSAQSEITECPMCPDCPDNCPMEVEHEQDG